MTLRKWTNRTGRALAALGLATVVLLLAACSVSGGSPVTGPAGRTAGGPAGGSAVASAPTAAAPLTARPAVTASIPAPAAHSTRLSGRPSATTAAAPGSGQAARPAVVAPAGSRVVTFVNRVPQTIWVAASPDAAHPLAATGWVLPAGQSVSIVVPDHYNGRFWGRTGCVFSGGHGHCQTGDCNGLFQCTGYGSIPDSRSADSLVRRTLSCSGR